MEKSSRDSIQSPDTYEQEAFLNIFPQDISDSLRQLNSYDKMVEVVLDWGRCVEVRYQDSAFKMPDRTVTQDDIQGVIQKVGMFDRDNRGGIEGTLHRVSAIYNRRGDVVGLTCRVGRALFGKIDIVKDIVKQGKSILILGRPGIGKTTLLREIARYQSDNLDKRVIIIDSNNEIGGDGNVPHFGVGSARRMQVPLNKEQYDVMIEAVENHNPQVIIVDEIGKPKEAQACRTIAERGVILIGTAHGCKLENLIANPTLVDLIGGVQSVTLSDAEAERRETQKTVLERKAAPSFDTLIEIDELDVLKIYTNLAEVVDRSLRGFAVVPEIRRRISDTQYTVEQKASADSSEQDEEANTEVLKLYCNEVSESYARKAIKDSHVKMELVDSFESADYVLSACMDSNRKKYLKEKVRRNGATLIDIKKNNLACIKEAIAEIAG